MASAVDWSEINPELLDLIIRRLDLVEFIRAGAVCRSWWSATSTYISPPKSPMPWLILSSPSQPELRYVSNPSDPKSLYKFNLPNIKHHLIIGSSHGFIVSIDEIAQIHATNPVTGSHRLLPSTTTVYGFEGVVRDPATNQISSYLIRKTPRDHHSPLSEFTVQHVQKYFYRRVAIFPTSSAGFISVIIHNYLDELAFARESDESWTFIQSPMTDFEDVIFYNGLLYAVNWKGDLVAFDILNFPASSIPVIRVKGWAAGYDYHCANNYLVQSPCGSDIFSIAKFMTDDGEYPMQTFCFKVYKLNQDIYQWFEVSSFGTNHAVVFLGFNRSVMLLAKDIPSIAISKGNCIYFTDDSYSSRRRKKNKVDMGIFCMEDKEIVPLDISGDDLQQFSFPPPFWFTPVISK